MERIALGQIGRTRIIADDIHRIAIVERVADCSENRLPTNRVIPTVGRVGLLIVNHGRLHMMLAPTTVITDFSLQIGPHV